MKNRELQRVLDMDYGVVASIFEIPTERWS